MILVSQAHLTPDDLCIVGVSGGADSVCLLHALRSLGHRLTAVHVNHHLRPEADQEAAVVERFALELRVDFVLIHIDVASYANTHSLSIEEAARELRYHHLFEQAENLAARAVLVAHNADDQVETILMHLLRGTGLTGLGGMSFVTHQNPWSHCIPIVRPLLSTSREEILAYLDSHHVSFITDASNNDLTYLRNRVRHELLPYLESYNPRIRENLLRMGMLNQEDYSLIQQVVTATWQAMVIKRGPGYLALDLPGFQSSQVSIQRYLLRKAIAYHLPSLRDIDANSILRGLQFLNDRQIYGQIDLLAGLRLLKEGDTFWLATWQAELPGNDFPSIPMGAVLTVDIPALQALDGNWEFQAVEQSDLDEALIQCSSNSDPFVAWFDLDELHLPLIIRCRISGDRIQPHGMDGHSIKISDLMVNLKVPRRVRQTWPLVCSGQSIIWVPGCRQSELAQVHKDSRRIVRLSLHKDSSA